MPTKVRPPTEAELTEALGPAAALWSGILHALEETFTPLDRQWRPSKTGFGRVCLLHYRKRTLLYLTPEKATVRVAIVLGERAYGLAMASALPAAIKKLLSEAKPYAEGRGIRFPVSAFSDVPVVKQLVEIKTTPK